MLAASRLSVKFSPGFRHSKPTSAPKASGNGYQAYKLGAENSTRRLLPKPAGFRFGRQLKGSPQQSPRPRKPKCQVAADQKALCTADISDPGLSYTLHRVLTDSSVEFHGSHPATAREFPASLSSCPL